MNEIEHDDAEVAARLAYGAAAARVDLAPRPRVAWLMAALNMADRSACALRSDRAGPRGQRDVAQHEGGSVAEADARGRVTTAPRRRICRSAHPRRGVPAPPPPAGVAVAAESIAVRCTVLAMKVRADRDLVALAWKAKARGAVVAAELTQGPLRFAGGYCSGR